MKYVHMALRSYASALGFGAALLTLFVIVALVFKALR
jgi:hypothetical protein